VYEIVDLSQEIYTDAPRFPGHPATRLEYVARHEEMEHAPIKPKDITYAAMMLHLCDHGPTHVDSISHIDERESAPSIDQSPLENFLTPAIALEFTGMVEPGEEISLQLLQSQLSAHALEPPEDGTFLFTGGHYRRTFPRDAYMTEYPGLSREAADYLYRDAGVINIGQDAPSIEAAVNANAMTFPCHVLCRELQRHNTENLANIEDVAGKEFVYAGLPLKIRDGTGSPIRAVAILGL
jgi:kynurenine formamidase